MLSSALLQYKLVKEMLTSTEIPHQRFPGTQLVRTNHDQTDAFATCPCSPPAPVHVPIGSPWDLTMHHMLHLRDVESTSRDVGRQ